MQPHEAFHQYDTRMIDLTDEQRGKCDLLDIVLVLSDGEYRVCHRKKLWLDSIGNNGMACGFKTPDEAIRTAVQLMHSKMMWRLKL